MMNLIAFGQLSTDSITISRDQQRQCIKWHNSLQYKDSIIGVQKEVIENQDNQIKNRNIALDDCKVINDDLTDKNTKLEKKSKRRLKIAIVEGGIIAGLIAFLIIF